MKDALSLLIACAFACSPIASATVLDDMAATSLLYGVELSRKSDDETKKEFFLNQTGESMFLYWMESHKSGSYKNQRVDLVIKTLYTDFKVEPSSPQYQMLFEDPLEHWFSSNNLRLKELFGDKPMTKYKSLLSEYHAFLNSNAR